MHPGLEVEAGVLAQDCFRSARREQDHAASEGRIGGDGQSGTLTRSHQTTGHFVPMHRLDSHDFEGAVVKGTDCELIARLNDTGDEESADDGSHVWNVKRFICLKFRVILQQGFSFSRSNSGRKDVQEEVQQLQPGSCEAENSGLV